MAAPENYSCDNTMLHLVCFPRFNDRFITGRNTYRELKFGDIKMPGAFFHRICA